MPNRSDTYKTMLESVKSSLKKLNIEKLNICYLHQNEINIISDPYVHDGINQLKKDGLISKVGVSLYNFQECEYAIDSGIYDYIQIPLSVFDVTFYDRFIKDNSYPVRFVARSLFLQGVLVNRKRF